MSPFKIYFVVVFLVNIALGISVFATNHRRTANQLYSFLSVIAAFWLSSNWTILTASDANTAQMGIKYATAIAIFIPASCHLLRLAILYPLERWSRIIYRARYLLAACMAVSILCFSEYFILEVRLPNSNSSQVPEPVYGWAYLVFTALFIGMVLSLLISFRRDRVNLLGFQRIELDFITMGYSLALLTGTACGLIVNIVTGSSQTVPMANTTSILALTLIVSYGIATKRILGIATIFRNIIAYTLLTCYLLVLYFFILHGSSWLLNKMHLSWMAVPHVLSTLAVAFSMSPAHGKLQKVSALLVATKSMNVADAMKKAGNIFQAVSTKRALQDQFTRLLARVLGSESITVLLSSDTSFVQSFPLPPPSETGLQVQLSDAVTRLLEKNKEPLCKDSLIRTRNTSDVAEAIRILEQLSTNVAVGVFFKAKLIGVVLFGPKKNGAIYDKTEQDALQILCNQFAVALENARLYTEMQDNKIRNDIMLDQLVSGVVVADPGRTITLFNHEAQHITGIAEHDAIGMSIDILPKPIIEALETTLENEAGIRNLDAVLFGGDEEESASIRMGSAFLHGHDGKPMGALLVFTDTTEIKSLEEQVRRSAQLSSVGTLAAGMAHEIKNPLVTIKTFTQLLPVRYSDEDFRRDFASLVAHEVQRIDGIVNELLSFSKPTKPNLVPMSLHDTLEHILKLVHEQMVQKNIVLKKNCRAELQKISGDDKLLSQALVNLLLNAIEAIGMDGTITVGTANCHHRFAPVEAPDRPVTRHCIRLHISDTGKGIPPEHLGKIFDPFFTSKSEGTGMGLSVAHGIISEHHGLIDVESEPGRGTTFFVYLPVLEEAVAA